MPFTMHKCVNQQPSILLPLSRVRSLRIALSREQPAAGVRQPQGAASRLPLGRRQRPPPLIPRRRAGGKASQAHEEVDEGDDEDGRQRRRYDAHDDARAAVVDVERLLWRRINKISKQSSSAAQLCGKAVV